MPEIWTEVFTGVIPKQKYSVKATSGEGGLIIQLVGQEYDVLIDFGVVNGIQIMDEGMLLCCPPPQDALRENDYPNTIYLVENGAFGSYSKCCVGPDLYADNGYREYAIVTLNYVIFVITVWEPDITVTQIK